MACRRYRSGPMGPERVGWTAARSEWRRNFELLKRYPPLCGIAGFTHKSWTPDPDRIRAATATLTHRGPDQQGVFHSRLCSMGATRLKILDLASGDQPLFSSDGDTVIV